MPQSSNSASEGEDRVQETITKIINQFYRFSQPKSFQIVAKIAKIGLPRVKKSNPA